MTDSLGKSQPAGLRGPVMMPVKCLIAAMASAAWLAGAQGLEAQDLKIALSAEPSAIDPHFHNLAPNHAMAKHIFEALIDQDENQRLVPALALSWRTTNDTT